jgi:hypothetical protein
MAVYSEESVKIPVGMGLDTYNHPARLEPGFSVVATNVVAKQDRLVTRYAFIPPFDVISVEGDLTIGDPIDTRSDYAGTGEKDFYSQIAAGINPDYPIAIWAQGEKTWAIRQFDTDNPSSTVYDEAYIADFSSDLSNFRGACTYLDRIYVNANGIISRCTAWGWEPGDVTKTTMNTDGPTNSRGLFVFKDRMWTWEDDKIWYTDVPASPGAYAEVWGDTNFITIGSGTGLGKIQSIIPVGTSLFVFTESGLYTVAIIGSPINWVVRLIDQTVCVDSPNCAYHYKGLVFFIDRRGVWVTEGGTVKSISEKIKNIFNDNTISIEATIRHKLVPLHDGILICRSLLGRNGTFLGASLYFTPLDYIAWTKFELSTSISQASLRNLIAGFTNIETHKLWGANNFVVLVHDSTSDGSTPTAELKWYIPYPTDVFQNSGAPNASEASVVSTVRTGISTHRELEDKRSLYGYLNIDAMESSEDLNISYRWITEHQTTSQELIDSELINTRSAQIKIEGPDIWRQIQLEVVMTSSDEVYQYSLLGASLETQSHRKTPRELS